MALNEMPVCVRSLHLIIFCLFKKFITFINLALCFLNLPLDYFSFVYTLKQML